MTPDRPASSKKTADIHRGVPDEAPASTIHRFGGDTPARAAISRVTVETITAELAADLTAAQGGDPQAFARLYDRHAAVVLSLCRRLGSAEAEDAVQETFIRAYRMLDKVASPQKLRPWLYGIARFVCAEQRRAAHRRSKHEAEAMMTRTAELQATAPAGAPVEQAEDLERLDDALNAIDDRERLAIHLYYLESDPVQAAESALGLSRSGFYKLLGRAREHLANLMRGAESS